MSWVDRFRRWRVVVRGRESGSVYAERLFLTRRGAVGYQDEVNGAGYLVGVLERVR